MTEIPPPECYELLASRSVGRIAFVVDGAPSVVPVNHTVDGEDIVFRTSPHSELGRSMVQGPVAFQVDDFDDFSQTGWSVLVQGTVHYDDSDEVSPENPPRPWVEGVRGLLVRVQPRLVTGRRLIGV
ncbi:MAG: pyridoxamine 5'-phosphate oxidase family protein [Nocardioides sp.]|nr:pyridoxamine 5'-phosphate oxidase family protein [Nocardioides sp.]